MNGSRAAGTQLIRPRKNHVFIMLAGRTPHNRGALVITTPAKDETAPGASLGKSGGNGTDTVPESKNADHQVGALHQILWPA